MMYVLNTHLMPEVVVGNTERSLLCNSSRTALLLSGYFRLSQQQLSPGAESRSMDPIDQTASQVSNERLPERRGAQGRNSAIGFDGRKLPESD